MKNPDMTATQMVDRIILLEAERDRFQRLAETDQLTQLPNRRALERRTHARDGWFVMADLNGFKKAQDAHPDGHQYGDRILQEFAEFLDSSCRTGRGRCDDRVSSRLGGDEFVVWCPTNHGARRIKRLIRSWVSRDGQVRAAAGMGKDLESADGAMYMSKQGLRSPR
jgi:GGDEF domain-containing protein